MHPYRAYQQPVIATWTRIDMLLALYEETIKQLQHALAALRRDDRDAANGPSARAQVLIAGLAAGVDVRQGELPRSFLRLYDFALHSVRQQTVAGVEAALGVLRTVEEGLVAIRPQAQELELTGQVPSADAAFSLRATA